MNKLSRYQTNYLQCAVLEQNKVFPVHIRGHQWSKITKLFVQGKTVDVLHIYVFLYVLFRVFFLTLNTAVGQSIAAPSYGLT